MFSDTARLDIARQKNKRHLHLRNIHAIAVVVLIAVTSTYGRGDSDKPAEFHIQAARAALEKAQSELQDKHPTEASEDLRRAIQIEPTYMEAFTMLVEAYTMAGNKLEEAAALTRLLQIEGNRPADRIRLGQLLLQQEQPQRALAQFSSALALQPGNADALFGFATAAKQAGLQDRATEAMASGRSQHPNDTRFKP